jgi:chromosome segregation ATPase
MLVDVVKVQGGDGAKRAVAWACGATVVAPSLEVGRQLAFGDLGRGVREEAGRARGEGRVKVVCEDGSVIHKSGAMSAGAEPQGRPVEAARAAAGRDSRKRKSSGKNIPEDIPESGDAPVMTSLQIAQSQSRLKEIVEKLALLRNAASGEQDELMRLRTK